MQRNKKRLKFCNRDHLINHPTPKRPQDCISGCGKCNYYAPKDGNHCEVCYKKLSDDDE